MPEPALTDIPVIVAAELRPGVKQNPETHRPHAGRLDAFLSLFRIVDSTPEAARHYADIRAALESVGTPIGPLDLLIAGQVRRLDATLVTANTCEFRRVKGLKILPWK